MTKLLFRDAKIRYLNVVLLTVCSSVFFVYLSELIENVQFLVSDEGFLYQISYALFGILLFIHLYFHSRFVLQRIDVTFKVNPVKEKIVYRVFNVPQLSYYYHCYIRFLVIRI
ncbi:MAG: hypothetical protein RBQ95_02560 [Paracholeplasma sp.]|nr:hypothetical protein [Paracholeplasma sp.]MDY3195719.1 hypothetical protein [Paracholeplasma sp.]